jgi:hypothetical protein
MIRTTITALMIVACVSACADTQAPSISDTTQVLSLKVENGLLAGPGGDMIRENLGGAQFVLIGEVHGFAESPELALAVAQAGRPHGFKYHVVEVGTIEEEWATNSLLQDGPNGLSRSLAGRDFILPFLSLREDAELAHYFLQNAPVGEDAVWGIDQESLGSTIIHLETLNALTQDSSVTALLRELIDAELAAWTAGDQSRLFLLTVTDETFAVLTEAFSESVAALRIIAALKESAAIYKLSAAGEGEANTRRANVMRRQFFNAYRAAAEPVPRVLFKTGAIHAGRGTTSLNTFDIGSIVEGVAAANDLNVLRIAVMPISGERAQVQANGLYASVEYDDSSDRLWQIIGVNPNEIGNDGWSLIPFAPIRARFSRSEMNALPAGTRVLLLGYDFLVTRTGAHAATPL